MTDIQDIPENQRTKCQRFSRIVGYYRPLSAWNDGKQAEWKERKSYTLPLSKDL